MTIYTYKDDLPNDINFENSVAIDTETLGLNLNRDRLCLIQFSSGDGNAHLVQISKKIKNCKNIVNLLQNKNIEKIFHFARFDMAILQRDISVINGDIFCTKIASKLCRTYTNKHGLLDLCAEFLNIEISKQQQSSNWAKETLSDSQKEYAANDVLYLHQIKQNLLIMLKENKREEIASECFQFLKTRINLDLIGFNNIDIFQH